MLGHPLKQAVGAVPSFDSNRGCRGGARRLVVPLLSVAMSHFMSSRLPKLVLGVAVVGFAVFGLSAPAQATTCPSTTPVAQGDISDGANYTVCNFDNFSFAGLHGNLINFTLAHLANAIFSGATFTNSDFSLIVGGGQDFRGATMTGDDFDYAELGGSQLSASTSFAGSSFRHTPITDVHGSGANFAGADLSNARMYRSDFTNANFTNVNFTDVLFVNVLNLVGPDLSGANLTGATGLNSVNLADATLSPSTICPDGVYLSLHIGDCFSQVRPLVPIFDTPVPTTDGFTVNIINYDGNYTFTASIVGGGGTATLAPPSDFKLPILVTGVPTGATSTLQVDAEVVVYGSIVPVAVGTATISATALGTLATGAAALAATGVDGGAVAGASGLIAGLLVVGVAGIVFGNRRRVRP
jgi:uncharacterized protein YjbI with pentapeptide repeats